MKTYFHVDMDAFFVSVEELFDPTLKGKPVVVGGQVQSARSRFGRLLRRAQVRRPLRHAAPHRLPALPASDFRGRASGRAIAITRARSYAVLKTFSPQVDMASVDEAYMDITGTERLHGPPLRAAHRLHDAVKRETDLNCSIGIAASRMVAKVASDQAKPNGDSLGPSRPKRRAFWRRSMCGKSPASAK